MTFATNFWDKVPHETANCQLPTKHGFTLVELSIALVIIGLLIGGILIGQSLIDSARINRLVSDIYQYEVAAVQFQNKFKRYPGDNAFFTPPGAPNNELRLGDIDGDGLADLTNCNEEYANTEYNQFWAHLSQSKMLSKNYVPLSPDSCPDGTHNYTEDGVYAPYTKLIGGPAIASSGWGTTSLISASKDQPGYNLALTFALGAADAIAISNKMSATDFLWDYKQIGLAAFRGVGTCMSPSDGDYTFPCNSDFDSIADFGYGISPP